MDITISRYHVPSLLLVVLAISVIVGSFIILEPGVTKVTYHVVPASEGNENVREFSTLSNRGQEVFKNTLESADNSKTVSEYPWQNRIPKDIEYNGEGRSLLIRYNGNVYELRAEGGGLFQPSLFYYVIPLTVSLWFLKLSYQSFQKPRPRLPLTILVGLAIGALVSTLWANFWSEDFWLIILTSGVGMGVTWRLLFYIWNNSHS